MQTEADGNPASWQIRFPEKGRGHARGRYYRSGQKSGQSHNLHPSRSPVLYLWGALGMVCSDHTTPTQKPVASPAPVPGMGRHSSGSLLLYPKQANTNLQRAHRIPARHQLHIEAKGITACEPRQSQAEQRLSPAPSFPTERRTALATKSCKSTDSHYWNSAWTLDLRCLTSIAKTGTRKHPNAKESTYLHHANGILAAENKELRQTASRPCRAPARHTCHALVPSALRRKVPHGPRLQRTQANGRAHAAQSGPGAMGRQSQHAQALTWSQGWQREPDLTLGFHRN